MDTTIIDRRLNGKGKSHEQRARFLQRIDRQVRKQITDRITGKEGSLDTVDISLDVTVPKKDLSQPVFKHGEGGVREIVHPGNEEYIKGDRIDRDDADNWSNRQAGDAPDSLDDYIFDLSLKEHLTEFMRGRTLPNRRPTNNQENVK